MITLLCCLKYKNIIPPPKFICFEIIKRTSLFVYYPELIPLFHYKKYIRAVHQEHLERDIPKKYAMLELYYRVKYGYKTYDSYLLSDFEKNNYKKYMGCKIKKAGIRYNNGNFLNISFHIKNSENLLEIAKKSGAKEVIEAYEKIPYKQVGYLGACFKYFLKHNCKDSYPYFYEKNIYELFGPYFPNFTMIDIISYCGCWEMCGIRTVSVYNAILGGHTYKLSKNHKASIIFYAGDKNLRFLVAMKRCYEEIKFLEEYGFKFSVSGAASRGRIDLIKKMGKFDEKAKKKLISFGYTSFSE